LQKSAIWSNVRDVFSTSQTAVAFGISGALLMTCSLRRIWRRAANEKSARLIRFRNSGSGPVEAYLNSDHP
jgi:hypothetical protein